MSDHARPNAWDLVRAPAQTAGDHEPAYAGAIRPAVETDDSRWHVGGRYFASESDAARVRANSNAAVLRQYLRRLAWAARQLRQATDEGVRFADTSEAVAFCLRRAVWALHRPLAADEGVQVASSARACWNAVRSIGADAPPQPEPPVAPAVRCPTCGAEHGRAA